MKPDDRRKKLAEQRRGDDLMRRANVSVIVVMSAIVIFFTYSSLMRHPAPFAFLPTFLIGVLVMIFGMAYFLTVMIRKDV